MVEKYIVDGFLVLANAMVTTYKSGNFTEISDIKCYTLNFTSWSTGTAVRKKALHVSILNKVCNSCWRSNLQVFASGRISFGNLGLCTLVRSHQ